MREAATKRAANPARRPVVMIVEDEILIRSATAANLRQQNFSVLEASNGAEAIEVLASDTPVDLIFTDVVLSHPVDGLELLRWIVERRLKIPVILTSGQRSFAAAARNIARDAKFVPKPYRINELADYFRVLLIDRFA
jgi:DNA-binding NtrC family response regulator